MRSVEWVQSLHQAGGKPKRGATSTVYCQCHLLSSFNFYLRYLRGTLIAKVHTYLYKCDISFFLFYRQLHVTVLPFTTLWYSGTYGTPQVYFWTTYFFRLTLNAESDHISSLINVSPLEDYKNVLWRHLVSLSLRENIL